MLLTEKLKDGLEKYGKEYLKLSKRELELFHLLKDVFESDLLIDEIMTKKNRMIKIENEINIFFGIKLNQKNRGLNYVRARYIFLVSCLKLGYTNKEISNYLNLERTTLIHLNNNYKQGDKSIISENEEIIKRLIIKNKF